MGFFKTRKQRAQEEHAMLLNKLSPQSRRIYDALNPTPQYKTEYVRKWISQNPGEWVSMFPWEIVPGDIVRLLNNEETPFYILAGGASARARGIQFTTSRGIIEIDSLGGTKKVYVTYSGTRINYPWSD